MDNLNQASISYCENGIISQFPSAIRNYFININQTTSAIFKYADYIYEKTDLSSTQRPSVYVNILEHKEYGTSEAKGKIQLEIRLSLPDQTMRQEKTLRSLQISSIFSNISLRNFGLADGSLLKYCQGILGGNDGQTWLWRLGATPSFKFDKLNSKKDTVLIAELDYWMSIQSYIYWLDEHGYTLDQPDIITNEDATGIIETIILE